MKSKTEKSIIVPISSYLVNELQAYKAGRDSQYLFDDQEIKQCEVLEYSKYFGKLFKQLGISNFTFHNLKHTFASLQSDLGIGAITTKGLLGHSDLSMTLRYSHTGLDSKRKAVESLTEHILSINMTSVVSQTGTAQMRHENNGYFVCLVYRDTYRKTPIPLD